MTQIVTAQFVPIEGTFSTGSAVMWIFSQLRMGARCCRLASEGLPYGPFYFIFLYLGSSSDVDPYLS
jgi:hypothetical protein